MYLLVHYGLALFLVRPAIVTTAYLPDFIIFSPNIINLCEYSSSILYLSTTLIGSISEFLFEIDEPSFNFLLMLYKLETCLKSILLICFIKFSFWESLQSSSIFKICSCKKNNYLYHK